MASRRTKRTPPRRVRWSARVLFTCLQRTWLVKASADLDEPVKDGALQQAMPEANTVTRELTKQMLRQRGLWAVTLSVTCWRLDWM